MNNFFLHKMRWMSALLLLLLISVVCNKTTTTGINEQNQNQSDNICQTVTVDDALSMIQENQNNPDFVILDVRTQNEFDSGHIEKAVNFDFYSASFSDDLNGLDKSQIYLVYCRSGNRSGQAVDIMKTLNFREVYNMSGGITQWTTSGYPVVN